MGVNLRPQCRDENAFLGASALRVSPVFPRRFLGGQTLLEIFDFAGAAEGIRTPDPRITKPWHAQPATIFLPNRSVRSGTGAAQARAFARKWPLIQTHRHGMVGANINVAERMMPLL
jgi:hypothetical protein